MGFDRDHPGTLELQLVDASDDQPVPARVYVTGADGGRYFDPRCQRYVCGQEAHFVAEGSSSVEAPPGDLTVQAERGPEFLPATATVFLPPGGRARARLAVRRWVDMPGKGWHSGDLHVHRRPDEMPLALRAEDLNLACLVATHAREHGTDVADWAKGHKGDWLAAVDEDHVYSLFDHERERLGTDGYGAVVCTGLVNMVLEEPGPLWPPDPDWLEKCRSKGAHVDAEKPFWRATPENVALGFVDSMGVICNHLHRRGAWLDAQRWGAWEAPSPAGLTERGFVQWVMDCYYRYLNCGFKLPVTGGSASGIMPNPIGQNRVYVKVESGFSYGAWFSALRAGRSFATNGPMLSLEVDGRTMGSELELSAGDTVQVSVTADSARGLDVVDLVHNGETVATATAHGRLEDHLEISKRLSVRTTGWVAARAFERSELGPRCAQTSPVYITVPGSANPQKPKAARYFLRAVDALSDIALASEKFPLESQRTHALAVHERARQVFARMLG